MKPIMSDESVSTLSGIRSFSAWVITNEYEMYGAAALALALALATVVALHWQVHLPTETKTWSWSILD